MSTVTTTFSPAPGVTITVSIIVDEKRVTGRVFTSAGDNNHADCFSYPIIFHEKTKCACSDEYELAGSGEYELASTDESDLDEY